MPSGQLRHSWLSELYPDCDVKLVKDIHKDDDSKAWAEYTVRILGRAPDVVFTSEEYGQRWAKFLGCLHILVDMERLTVPVSGTLVRKNPISQW